MNAAARHVGVIPDGTRRWSRRRGVPLADGYLLAMENLARVVDVLYSAGVPVVSLYLLSLRNLSRSQAELGAVFEAETHFCARLLPQVLARHSARVSAVGELSRIPADYRQALHALDGPAAGTERRLYLLVAYDAWEELRAACAHPAPQAPPARRLGVREDVDLVLRTGGGNLLSGFLPLQSQYAHLHTVETLFNDLTPSDVRSALADFAGRERLQGS
ncbi:undecaprenyl diphosphate synthase family protein [Streptomyces sp. NPDC003016]